MFCDMVSNNICESFNKWILKARDKSIIGMIDMIRRMIMKRLSDKRKNIVKWKSNVCPGIFEMVAQIIKQAKVNTIITSGTGLYEVSHREERCRVDIVSSTCTCRMWELSGIPCKYAINALRTIRLKVEDYVHACYKKSANIRAYQVMLFPSAYIRAYQVMLFPIPDIKH